jgi:hypothetical protein
MTILPFHLREQRPSAGPLCDELDRLYRELEWTTDPVHGRLIQGRISRLHKRLERLLAGYLADVLGRRVVNDNRADPDGTGLGHG